MTLLEKFAENRRGNIAMMFAIASIPIIGGVAMTIEYTNLSTHQSKLQNAVDAAALFAGREAYVNNSVPDPDQVKDFMQANFAGALNNVGVNVIGEKLEISAATKAPAFFFGNIAPDVFNLDASATVPYGGNVKLEIAMVLDTTYSMNSESRLETLKTVGKQFIDDLNSAKNAKTEIEVGIVPFSNHVNVGLSNRNASWIQVPSDWTNSQNVCRTSYDPADLICTDGTGSADGISYDTTNCTPVSGAVGTQTCAVEDTEYTWFGCVGSRNSPYTFVDGDIATRIPGVLGSGNWHCPTELTPLTDQTATLKTTIDGLSARGDTYIAPGVMWGLRVLSAKAPYSQADEYGSLPTNTNHKKIMVLMTDGDNSKSKNVPSDASNWGSDISQANDDTKTACAAARDAGVTIYSISFGTSVSVEGKNVMKACAADPEQYFDASDATGLKNAFDSITAKILSLRLSS